MHLSLVRAETPSFHDGGIMVLVELPVSGESQTAGADTEDDRSCP